MNFFHHVYFSPSALLLIFKHILFLFEKKKKRYKAVTLSLKQLFLHPPPTTAIKLIVAPPVD